MKSNYEGQCGLFRFSTGRWSVITPFWISVHCKFKWNRHIWSTRFRVPQWPLYLLILLPFLRVKETFLRRVTNRKILNYCRDILNCITELRRRLFIMIQFIVVNCEWTVRDWEVRTFLISPFARVMIHSLTHGAEPFLRSCQCAATQELPSILWTPKFHYHVYTNLSLVPILSQINPIHTIISYLRSILILSSHLHLGLFSGPFWLSHEYPICIPLLPHTC
jgi:hypothetical protein